MRVVLLYRQGSETVGVAEDYAADYRRQHPDKEIELLDVDSDAGQQMAQLYDIVRYPALLAIADDGALQQLWQDEHLPLTKEVDFYLQT